MATIKRKAPRRRQSPRPRQAAELAERGPWSGSGSDGISSARRPRRRRHLTLLHPTDFSDCAAQAERQAVRLARALGAELVLFHVSVEAPLYSEGPFGIEDTRRFFETQRKWARETLIARAEAVHDKGVPARWHMAEGVPSPEIVRAAADEHADIIVMGTHGRAGLNRMLLGSVTDRVIRLAPCPVLTVRAAKNE